MQAAVAGLEARLARGGGSDADWTLLAQAYDYLGRSEDAARARAHTVNPRGVGLSQLSARALAAAAAAADGAATAPAPQQRSAPVPRDAQAWLALAEQRRTQRDYAAARDAYGKVIALDAMSAQCWADYADVLGSLDHGSLASDAAAQAIDRALALDGANPKALWLKASQAHEQRHFADALSWWRKLRAVLPTDSDDVRIIDGNIAEDGALAGAAPGAPAPAGAQLSGTVSIDARLAARVPVAATLFIYAKAADSPGPPLAVVRLSTAAWPVSFRLDDSMAMIPSRRLSQFERVVVEARISRTGQATPSPGDLYGTSPAVRPLAGGQKLVLLINREIG
jgi:cytochrome c-type biogenesis protein CcmH